MSRIESKGVIGTTDQCPHCKHIIPSPHCSQNIRTWAAKLSGGNENRHAIDSLFIIETQIAELAHLRTENARLLQIEADAKAAGLLTEDGALIVPGMRVWVPGLKPGNDDGSGGWIIGSIDHKESVIERQGWLLSQFRRHVGNPYSTREAAEAAREEKA